MSFNFFPRQTLVFSTVSKEQSLYKLFIGLNPVFQPILTVTMVTVNMGWNTGFCLATDLNKGCSLLTVLKPNVWRGVCSSVRLDTNILIGTSGLNCQTLKTPFSPNSSNQKDFFEKIGWYTFFLLYLWAKYELIWSDITAQTVTLGANLLVKAKTIPQNAKRMFFFKPKVLFTKDINIIVCWVQDTRRRPVVISMEGQLCWSNALWFQYKVPCHYS